MECKTSHIDLDKHLTAMLRKSGALVGLPIVAVSGHTENGMICRKSSHMSFEQMLLSCIGTDSCGKPALRVKFINSCTPYLDCTNNKDANQNNFRKMFAYDSTLKTFALVLNLSV